MSKDTVQLASSIEKMIQIRNRYPAYPTESEAAALLAHIEQLQKFVKAFEAHFIEGQAKPSISALMDMSANISLVNTGRR